MKNSIRAFSLSLLPLAVFMDTTGTASAAGYSDARNSAMGARESHHHSTVPLRWPTRR